jgi:hypothetical protein
MNDLTKFLADAHIEDLRRDADRFALGRAALAARRQGRPPHDAPITIRRATPDDDRALGRLASLDSASVPPGRVLLVESRGELRAALSLDNGATIADPFHPTAAIVELLVTWAKQDARSRRRLPSRWRRAGSRRRAARSPQTDANPVLS